MAQFVFKLEGLLRHRATLERERQRELAIIQAEMTRLEADLRQLDVGVQETNTDLRDNRLVGTLDLQFLAAHRRYMAAMQRKAMGIAQLMGGVQQRLADARKALVEAAKQKQVIEKLRENQLAAWRAEQARKELEALDEVSMQLVARRAGEADGPGDEQP